MHNSRDSSPLVLLIDDSVADQRLLTDVLERNRFRVAVALNGMDGYHKALLNRPELILLDVNMPGLDGFTVCRMLKSTPATQDIPLVFLTARSAASQREEGLRLGAVDYIPKSFSTETEVLARIGRHLPRPLRPPRQATADGEAAKRPSALIQSALEHLLPNLATPPTVTELAELVGTTETILNEAFRKELHLPLFAYIREQRLFKARELLANTNLPIRLIGEHVGYAHSGNFTTAFRLRFGSAPRQFRQHWSRHPPQAADAAAVYGYSNE